MTLLRTIGLAGLLVTGACVQTNTAVLGNAPARAPVAPEMVALYRTPAQVPGKYVEVALLYSDGTTGWTNEAGMLKSMRTKAGALGANGVLLDGITEPSAMAKVIASIVCAGAERKGRAIAIFVQPAATGP
jgi:hypothetical protein